LRDTPRRQPGRLRFRLRQAARTRERRRVSRYGARRDRAGLARRRSRLDAAWRARARLATGVRRVLRLMGQDRDAALPRRCAVRFRRVDHARRGDRERLRGARASGPVPSAGENCVPGSHGRRALLDNDDAEGPRGAGPATEEIPGGVIMIQIEVWGTGKALTGFTEDAVLTSARKLFPHTKAQHIARFIAGKRFIITRVNSPEAAQKLIDGLAKSGIEADTAGPPPAADAALEEDTTLAADDEAHLLEEVDEGSEEAQIPEAPPPAAARKNWILMAGGAGAVVVLAIIAVFAMRHGETSREEDEQARIQATTSARLAAKFRAEAEAKKQAEQDAAAQAAAAAKE